MDAREKKLKKRREIIEAERGLGNEAREDMGVDVTFMPTNGRLPEETGRTGTPWLSVFPWANKK